MSSKEILYILGAGRSGSTVLATILNNHEKIHFVGELHHFFSYLNKSRVCSCGTPIHNCEFWKEVLHHLPRSFTENPQKFEQMCRKMEYHSSIPSHMLGFKTEKEFDEYKDIQQKLISSIDQEKTSGYILDSAKYIGRFLALKKIFTKQVKGIFLVRDLRGVIYSFKKNVQTQNSPLKTYIYYMIINTLANFLSVIPGQKILKVRYEDVVDKPQKTLRLIGDFLELDLSESIRKIEEQKPFIIPHIIGGNRFKSFSEVTIKKDVKWLKKMPAYKKVFYYILALPLMIINKYKVFN